MATFKVNYSALNSFNYDGVPEYKAYEYRSKTEIILAAGRLMELLDKTSVLITLDKEDRPVIYVFEGPDGRMVDELDFELTGD